MAQRWPEVGLEVCGGSDGHGAGERHQGHRPAGASGQPGGHRLDLPTARRLARVGAEGRRGGALEDRLEGRRALLGLGEERL